MKIIKLRTKLEIIIAVVIILSLSILGVLSVTRILTNSSDNISTFIRNSNGNLWAVNQENLQAAIADVGSNGWVKVGDDLTITSPIQLNGKNNLILDFENNKVTLNGDISFIVVQSTTFSTVENVRIYPSAAHTASIIHLYNPVGSVWANRIRFNRFQNIVIYNTGNWIPGVGYGQHNFIGIHLEQKGDDYGSNMLSNTFRDIQMHGVKTGIWLECDSTTGWSNGNYFENIWIDQFVTAIHFDVSTSSNNGFNQNVFTHIKAQAATYTKNGVIGITRNGNHFNHVLMWDWYICENPEYEWSILNPNAQLRARWTYINAHLIHNRGSSVLDKGLNTVWANESP